jgi:hypothetical protein
VPAPRSDDDGHPAGLAVDRLDLSPMYVRPNVKAERTDGLDDRPVAANGSSGPVERRAECIWRTMSIGPLPTI